MNTRAFELCDVIDDDWLLPRLRVYLERRLQRDRPSDIITDPNVPAQFARFAVGMPYGRFRETISRREIRRAGVPSWFDPREIPGQFGIIRGDLRCYIQVEVDAIARCVPSTFDQTILDLVERTPEPLSMFDVNQTDVQQPSA